MVELFLKTTIPIFFLLGLGFFSRHFGIFKAGDEKIVNSYIYYFSLPAMFFTSLEQFPLNLPNLTFIGWAIIPNILIGVLFLFLFLFKMKRNTVFLLIILCGFASYAFYGIAYITFALPGESNIHMATLAAAFICVIGVFISILFLEIYTMEDVSWSQGLKIVLQKFIRNPLILSIIAGVLFSLFSLKLPLFLEKPIHMLGDTTAAVSIFMLGIFFYGRIYKKIGQALMLSFLRLVMMPLFACFLYSWADIPADTKNILLLMHGMPGAVALIVLSQRYHFEEEVIASYILLTSLAAGLSLNFWHFFFF